MKQWKTRSGYIIYQLISGRSNVFLLTSGNANILVDTSVSRSWKKLQKHLSKLKIKSIDYLVLTHAHFDHAANAKKIKETFGAKVIIQKEDENFILKGENILPNGTNFISKILIKLYGKKFMSLLKYEPCIPNIIVDNKFHLNESGFNAYLKHTPGHTPGSLCLVIDDEISIVGDTMFGVFKWSAFPPFAQNKDQMIKSWGELLKTNCQLFLPSHGTEINRHLMQKTYNKSQSINMNRI